MIKKPTHAEMEQELEDVFGNVQSPDNDVMNVGVSPGMAQAQQLMTVSQSAGQMMESTVARSLDAQRIALANMTTGCTQLLSNPNELEPKHKKPHKHKVNKRLFRLLSELKAAKKR
mmetsp:Transcript_8991/g.14997  ORF Transcript_8991/g.14997 Transcript_8991/m.14997 type:complete len:116 (-) Transcript_8991:464-811(-)